MNVTGGRPLPLLLGLQYLIPILFFLNLVATLVVCFLRLVRFLPFFFSLLPAT